MFYSSRKSPILQTAPHFTDGNLRFNLCFLANMDAFLDELLENPSIINDLNQLYQNHRGNYTVSHALNSMYIY